MTNISNCTFYAADTMYEIVAALRAGTGIFSAMCCLVVIIVIKLKKSTFRSQRLVLYLAITALLHSLSYSVARVNYNMSRPLFDDYCYFGGFFNFYTSWVEVLALSCLTFNLFFMTVTDKVDQPSWLGYFYLVIMYGLPIFWSWPPFLFHTYAATAGWCDLRMIDENCDFFTYGFIIRFVLWYGPVYSVVFLCFIVTMIACVIIHRRIRKWTEIHMNEKQHHLSLKLKNEVMPLIGYPSVYLLLTVFSLANAIDSAIHPKPKPTADGAVPVSTLSLWYLHVLTSPFRGAFIAIVYAIDSGTRKRIAPGHVYNLLCCCLLLQRKSTKPEERSPLMQGSSTTTDSTSYVVVERHVGDSTSAYTNEQKETN